MIPYCRNQSMPCAYFHRGALFMFFRIVGDPDSMPRKTPLQPLWAIKSIASSSELLTSKIGEPVERIFLLIINRQISLKRGKGTLKVSSIKTTFLNVAQLQHGIKLLFDDAIAVSDKAPAS